MTRSYFKATPHFHLTVAPDGQVLLWDTEGDARRASELTGSFYLALSLEREQSGRLVMARMAAEKAADEKKQAKGKG